MVQAGPRFTYNPARPTDRVLQPGDLVMTDIGARYRGYVADGGRGFTCGPADTSGRDRTYRYGASRRQGELDGGLPWSAAVEAVCVSRLPRVLRS